MLKSGMLDKEPTGKEIIAWMEVQPEGFHGIVTNPDGEEGFVSKQNGAFSFYKIGEGQDPLEVLEVAKKLHDSYKSLKDEEVTAEYLISLGERARSLREPKIQVKMNK